MRYILITLILATSAFAHAPFFVANEGQWEGNFTHKCEVGNAVYYVTQSGMTVDLREYKRGVSSLNARHDPFDRDPFGDREPARSKVRGHVLKLNLVGAYSAEQGDTAKRYPAETHRCHSGNSPVRAGELSGIPVYYLPALPTTQNN